LNPVKTGDESVNRGLFPSATNTDDMFASHDFKDILKTDATTEEGEDKVLMYFRVDKNCWTKLLQEWQQEHGTPLVGYERYYKLLYLVKL
jgi:hypothetical protein